MPGLVWGLINVTVSLGCFAKSIPSEARRRKAFRERSHAAANSLGENNSADENYTRLIASRNGRLHISTALCLRLAGCVETAQESSIQGSTQLPAPLENACFYDGN